MIEELFIFRKGDEVLMVNSMSELAAREYISRCGYDLCGYEKVGRK